ncbi:MAG: hypothetical protein COX62_00785 [Deltaproteobacteria bacterium CG_4_10_14_0_2_um_filter_43_8]|nr:MAG: hypothetical protein COV43_06945 [Deltaproteobacteria bacterium CG11_big_fil_rev_8_21_14_0_20_42_23]PJA22079.1 MAG: hypothetical protein COX62_00785 [Deltaproteobacteria bacterium CG_4_10_14_0_2_um_filter_43_8]PJC65251.1 MAG: hypothetical protein CO021_00250 [Deltaproteobacteria bacterium CG_4_9_14_0_2_um_filter_42_21]
MKFAITLHLLAALIWVGGMFFTYVVLRPASRSLAETSERLRLWSHVLTRFFKWVWLSLITLLVTGYWMIFAYYGGFKHLSINVHLMQMLGIIMMLMFMHVYFAPYKRLRACLSQGKQELADKQLNQIRMFALINLVLGIITVILGVTGKY